MSSSSLFYSSRALRSAPLLRAYAEQGGKLREYRASPHVQRFRAVRLVERELFLGLGVHNFRVVYFSPVV